jgi:hypothetical protein
VNLKHISTADSNTFNIFLFRLLEGAHWYFVPIFDLSWRWIKVMIKIIGLITTSAATPVRDVRAAMHITIGVIWIIPRSFSSRSWLAISKKKWQVMVHWYLFSLSDGISSSSE